jgi:PAS domain S-box-containing protein
MNTFREKALNINHKKSLENSKREKNEKGSSSTLSAWQSLLTKAKLPRPAIKKLFLLGGVSLSVWALAAYFADDNAINLPIQVGDSIRHLITRMKKMAGRNYDWRREFQTDDEYKALAAAVNSMAGYLEEYDASNLARIENNKQRIEAIINHMNDAVIGLDKNKNILFVNTKAEDLIGLSHDDLENKYAPDVASANDLMRELIGDLMNKKEQSEGEKPDILKFVSDNKQVYYVKETIPVIPADTSPGRQQVGAIIMLKNVTHFQEMDEAKTDFVAVASHELKTPIASINMSLRLLQDERIGQLNEEQARLITSIHNDTQRMKRTTSELLDLSKIESGNIQLNMQQAAPAYLIEYAYETMASQAAQKEINFKMEYDEELPPLKVDLQKTGWILVNLVSNAIRYTPPEGAVILKVEETRQAAKFSVVDTGKGIPTEYLDKIFSKYFQVRDNQNDKEGIGLGLAISREFIKAQGGEIGVESELGVGSTFYFTLPKEQES